MGRWLLLLRTSLHPGRPRCCYLNLIRTALSQDLHELTMLWGLGASVPPFLTVGLAGEE